MLANLGFSETIKNDLFQRGFQVTFVFHILHILVEQKLLFFYPSSSLLCLVFYLKPGRLNLFSL